MKLDCYLTWHFFKNQRPKCKPKTVKLSEKNIGQKLHDIEFGSGFFDMTRNPWVTQEKIDKFDFMKIFKFCASKDTIHSEKATHTMGDTIFKWYMW